MVLQGLVADFIIPDSGLDKLEISNECQCGLQADTSLEGNETVKAKKK